MLGCMVGPLLGVRAGLWPVGPCGSKPLAGSGGFLSIHPSVDLPPAGECFLAVVTGLFLGGNA